MRLLLMCKSFGCVYDSRANRVVCLWGFNGNTVYLYGTHNQSKGLKVSQTAAPQTRVKHTQSRTCSHPVCRSHEKPEAKGC